MSYSLIYIIVFMIVGLLALITLEKPSSKATKGVIVVIILALFCLSHDSYDYNYYTKAYNAVGQGQQIEYEIMFVALSQIGNRLGMSYDVFRAVIAAIEFLIINYVIKRNTDNDSYVWLLYLIFPCVYDSFVFRFFMGMVFGLCALLQVNKLPEKSALMKYFAFTVFAGLSHTSLWLLLVLIPLYYLSNGKKAIICIGATLAVYTVFSSKAIFGMLSLLPIREKVITLYSQSHANLNGIIFQWGMQLIYMLPCLIICVAWHQRKIRTDISQRNGQYFVRADALAKEMLSLNLAFLMVLPVQYYAINASRLQRMLTIMNYIYIAKGLDVWPRNRKALKLLGLLYALLLLFLSMFVTSKTNIEVVWNAHFNSNPLLNWLQ